MPSANGSPTLTLLDGRRGDLLGLGEPVARHEHPGQRRAGLAGVEERLLHAVADGLGEALAVEVVEQHVGRLAAELEGDLLHRLGAELGDALAGPRRPGERHHVDVGVGGDRLADLRSEAGHEVEHAGRQADLVDDLGEDEGVDRGDLARLEHDRAAGRHGVGDLGGDLVQRVVPRRDAADDTDRLAHDERVADLLLELVRLGRRRGLLEAVDRQADLDELRQPLGHPRLLGDGRGDLVGPGAEGVADAAEVLRPLLGATSPTTPGTPPWRRRPPGRRRRRSRRGSSPSPPR